jgi:rhamnogalacturonyl hydrolase YesR
MIGIFFLTKSFFRIVKHRILEKEYFYQSLPALCPVFFGAPKLHIKQNLFMSPKTSRNLVATLFALVTLSFGLAACGKTRRQSASLETKNPCDFGVWEKGASPREVGSRLVGTFLSNPIRIHKASNMIHYVETCTWQGSLRFAKQTGNDALLQRLVKRFDPVFSGQPPYDNKPLNVDTTVFGSVPLELYMRTGDKRFLKTGLALADAQWDKPDGPLPGGMSLAAGEQARLDATSREAVKHGLSWQTRYWIDDMYMITMLQTQTYRATGDKKYLNRAALEAVSYLGVLQQPNGLFFHATDAPFFWGRGNGWFAAGMSELLRALPANHPHRARIMEGYKKMMATLLKHQDSEGKWRQLIDDPNSWQESSGTGMFTYAFVTGVRHGWLDAGTYGSAARKGWLALVSWIDPDGRVRDVCEGTNAQNDRQHYLNRGRITGDLHGQAPVIWCANALME